MAKEPRRNRECVQDPSLLSAIPARGGIRRNGQSGIQHPVGPATVPAERVGWVELAKPIKETEGSPSIRKDNIDQINPTDENDSSTPRLLEPLNPFISPILSLKQALHLCRPPRILPKADNRLPASRLLLFLPLCSGPPWEPGDARI